MTSGNRLNPWSNSQIYQHKYKIQDQIFFKKLIKTLDIKMLPGDESTIEDMGEVRGEEDS